MKYEKGSVVQLNENSDWRGCLGIIASVPESDGVQEKEQNLNENIELNHRDKDKDRYIVGIPNTNGTVSYTFAEESDFVVIGRACIELPPFAEPPVESVQKNVSPAVKGYIEDEYRREHEEENIPQKGETLKDLADEDVEVKYVCGPVADFLAGL